MSDISKIKVSGVEYNVKDSAALRDAPSDGKQYARKDGAWSVVTGGGVTTAMSESLWALLEKTEYVTAPTDAEFTAFKAAWGLKYLASISAVYSGGNVPAGTNVEELRDDLVVTANYSDGTTETITDYLLAGVLYEGENTITVTYQLKTTTFTVTAEKGRLYLYKDGTQYTDITGGFVNVSNGFNSNGTSWTQGGKTTAISYGEDSFTIEYPEYHQATYRSAQKIDLTEYTSIHVLAHAETNRRGTITELSHETTEASGFAVIFGAIISTYNKNWAVIGGYQGEETIIDISDLSGEYYFTSAQRNGNDWYASLKQTVSAIWLE